MPGRPWTAAEDRTLQKHYRRTPAGVLAERLGRTKSSVHQRAFKLCLVVPQRPVTRGEIRTIRRMVKRGHCNRCIGRALGRERHMIAGWRRKLGFPTLGSGPSGACSTCVATIRANTERQLKKAGLASLAYLRIEKWRKLARDAGWPPEQYGELRFRAVEILNVLWRQGPLTRRQLAAATGMPWKGSRKSLTSNDEEGSYLANLVSRGLVVALQRGNTVRGQGRGCSTNVYMLPLGVEPQWPAAERRKQHV